MPTNPLETLLRPDPAPSRTSRRFGAALYAAVALALVVLVAFAADVNYAIAREYGGGIGLPWLVAGVAAVVWVLLVVAARDWLGRRPFGARVAVGFLVLLTVALVGGYQAAAWAGAHAKAEDARSAATDGMPVVP